MEREPTDYCNHHNLHYKHPINVTCLEVFWQQRNTEDVNEQSNDTGANHFPIQADH
jgi:hypothetical protein